MSKLIRITEAQLHEIIGNGAYLDSSDDTNEYRLGGAQISTDGSTGNYIDGDYAHGEPITSDELASMMARRRVRGMGRNILPESNQDLAGKEKTFQLSSEVVNNLKQTVSNYSGAQNDAGVKRAKSIVKNGRVSYDDAYRILDDIKKGNAGNLIANNDKLEHELENKIKSGTNISNSNREAKLSRGENIMTKSNKSPFQGKAHTPKGNNLIRTSYEN